MTTANFKLNLLPKKELQQVTTDKCRYYVNPETGDHFESVTTVLKNALDQSWLEEWKARVGEKAAEEISLAARERGTKIHKILEDFVLGIDNTTKVSAFQRKSIRLIKQHFRETIDTVYGVELQVYSKELEAAGTLDLFARYKLENTVIDYKTSKHQKDKGQIWHYFIQAAAYARMIRDLYGIEVPKILIVMIYGYGDIDFFEEATADYAADVETIFCQGRPLCF